MLLRNIFIFTVIVFRLCRGRIRRFCLMPRIVRSFGWGASCRTRRYWFRNLLKSFRTFPIPCGKLASASHVSQKTDSHKVTPSTAWRPKICTTMEAKICYRRYVYIRCLGAPNDMFMTDYANVLTGAQCLMHWLSYGLPHSRSTTNRTIDLGATLAVLNAQP